MHSAHDPIGAASARLLGAGIDRRERLFALRVLGVLLDHAAADGTVRLLPGALAGEFQLDRRRVDDAFLHLRAAGVLVPTPAGFRIDGYEGYDSGGVNAGTALALIADLLEAPARDRVTAPPPPAPSLAARAFPVLTAVVAVLLLLVAATTQGGDPNVALQVAGIEHEDAPDTTPPREPQRTPSSARSDAPTATGSGHSPTSTPPGSRPGSAPDRAPAPAGAPTTSVSGKAPPAAPVCPRGVPVIEIAAVTVLPLPGTGGVDESSSVPVNDPGWYVRVDGTVANEAEAALVVERFDVVIATEDGEEVLDGLDEPVALGAGEQADWSVATVTSLTEAPPDEEDVTTVLRQWRWADACR